MFVKENPDRKKKKIDVPSMFGTGDVLRNNKLLNFQSFTEFDVMS